MNSESKNESPSINLLKDYADQRFCVTTEELLRKRDIICKVLKENNNCIKDDIRAFLGPAFTEYNVALTPGAKIRNILALEFDIASAADVSRVRIISRPGSVAVEIPNDRRSIAPLKMLLSSEAFRESPATLPLAIGYKANQSVRVIDLATAPHILVAGATKQGVSMCLNTLVASILFSKGPEVVKMVFIDPTGREFSAYNELSKHYLPMSPGAFSYNIDQEGAIVETASKALNVLDRLCEEMEARETMLMSVKAKSIKEYTGSYMPYVVCFVNEFSYLTVPIGDKESKALTKRITNAIIRLAQKGHSVGIHMILATQRPSTDVITGIIKAHFPTRIAFRTSSQIDSKTILDVTGAEKLIGEGDLLLRLGDVVERMQGGFICAEEIKECENIRK